MTIYYKFLNRGRMATHVTGFQWPEPGEWLTVDGPLVPCENGLHVLRWDQLLEWTASELWTVEVDESEVIDHEDKVVVRRARLIARVDTWSERTARLFAADCAERVLPIFEAGRPGDDRPRWAIEVARAYARGEATADDLTAARAAAWAAARAAARGAAWAAARGAAGAAAWGAARAAAGAAAGDAARAAAWAAARGAAWAAARDAAGDAARDWQCRHLADMLGIEVPE